uniref:Basement membrane-specific heparan sulfate proteoglycan core protein n=1 Tax=Ditylenchus dipsaci TaxID=166011 RepID=A0A915ECC2_9BILA
MVDRGRKLLATSTSYSLISWTAKMNGLALIATTLFLLLSIPTSVVGQKNRHFKESTRGRPSEGELTSLPNTNIKPKDSKFSEVQITVYPHELSIREGKEASFECRARTSDNAAYPEVRWTRVGGRLPENAYESGGRLSFNPTQMAHTGRYACVAVHQGRSVEAYATLHVQSYGPREFQQQNTLPDGASAGCMADEKACGSNECVKADYVCDGEPDCRDRSDEMNCPTKRHCEPNEFRCNNDRCVQKMWLCDGDDDCGDRSDEMNCKQRQSGDMCQPTEFKCKDGRQCVPQSFQCDGTNDCQDGSDEYGCAQPTVVQPPDSNKQVSGGSEFKLTCRAVGVPDPYINWRLNWGPVCEPPRCQQVSEAGVGTLTVQNAQPLDQGAYTCEAINVKGRVLATPDCIVRIVNIPAPPPPPPSRPQITCNPQGAFTPYADTRGQCQCKPQVEGPSCNQCAPGSFNLNEKSPQGEKLFFSGDSQGIVMSDINHRVEDNVNFDYETYGFLTHKDPHSRTLYWKLPQRFMGDKVTAYGGQMSIQLQYQGSGPISSEPLVVLKGNGITLVHKPRDQESVFTPNGPFTVTIPTYEQSYEHLSSGPATREDLMMVLADLDGFLIRATHVDDQQSTRFGFIFNLFWQKE